MRKLKNEELKRLSMPKFKSVKKTPIIVVLENIRSLNNIGSVFRTADSFLIEKIALCGITAKPPHRDIQKTALGATESVEWEHYKIVKEAIESLRDKNTKIIGIEQVEGSILLDKFNVNVAKKYILIFGNEVNGVSQGVIDICDEVIEIPQLGTKHSLNIAVSAGIVMWDIFTKLQK